MDSRQDAKFAKISILLPHPCPSVQSVVILLLAKRPCSGKQYNVYIVIKIYYIVF